MTMQNDSSRRLRFVYVDVQSVLLCVPLPSMTFNLFAEIYVLSLAA